MLGPTQVAAYAKKFGFAQDFRPFLSMALGAQEVTLLEITSAYSAFPNHGIRMEPYFADAINDRDGSLLEERRPQPQGRHSRRHRVRADEPDAGRRPARHRRRRQRAQLAARRQDRHGGRQHRRVVRGLRSEHHRRRVDRQRREEADRLQRDRHDCGAADVDGFHEGLHRALRRPRELRRSSNRPATSSSCRSIATPASLCRARPWRSSTKRSFRGRNRSDSKGTDLGFRIERIADHSGDSGFRIERISDQSQAISDFGSSGSRICCGVCDLRFSCQCNSVVFLDLPRGICRALAME